MPICGSARRITFALLTVLFMKKYWSILKDTGTDFMEDKALRLAAALAYYAVFSIGPLLVLIVGVAGLVMGEDSVRRQVEDYLKGNLGEKSAGLLQSMMTQKAQNDSLMATIIGGVALLFGASGVFGQLQEALNTVWEVQSKPNQGIMGFIRQRFLSMTMVLGVGFLLLISMVLTTVLSSLGTWMGGLISTPPFVLQTLNFVLSFVIVALLFAAIFKALPDVNIEWKDVWVGAVVTSLLFTVGKHLLAWYLGRESTTSAFGAGAAFVVILLYIYYSSVILFFGAEFTQVWAKAHGKVIEPSKNAERVSEAARANQGTPRKGKVPPTKPSRGGAVPLPGLAYAGGSAATSLDPASSTGSYKSHMKSSSISTSGTPFHYGSALTGKRVSPLQALKNNPVSFLVMAAGAGAAAAFLLKFKTARRLLKVYTLARRFM